MCHIKSTKRRISDTQQKNSVNTDLYVCPYGSDLRAPFTRGALFFLLAQLVRKISLAPRPIPYSTLSEILDDLLALT
jgi:hypothetical protein